jgi:hypothetical protein
MAFNNGKQSIYYLGMSTAENNVEYNYKRVDSP